MIRFTFFMVMALLAIAEPVLAREPSSYFSGGATQTKGAGPAKSAGVAGQSGPETLALPPPLPAKKGTQTLPPLELPPLPGMEPSMPPSPRLQPPERRESKLFDKPKAAEDSTKSGPEKEKAISPFMSRAELDAKRKACKLEFSGNPVLAAVGSGEDLRIKFRNAGAPCLSGAAPEDAWIDASINSVTSEVSLTVALNPQPVARSTMVNVIAGNQSFVFTVKQGAGKAQGCLRAKVRKAQKAIPEGFEE